MVDFYACFLLFSFIVFLVLLGLEQKEHTSDGKNLTHYIKNQGFWAGSADQKSQAVFFFLHICFFLIHCTQAPHSQSQIVSEF